MTGLTLDAGALIAVERGDRAVMLRLQKSLDDELEIVIPASVLAQVWRDGRTQVRLARFLAQAGIQIEVLDDYRARAAGQLCGVAGVADIVDASVVLCARMRKHVIMTGDREDILAIDPHATIIDC
jgi:hypothetical protein